MEIPVDYFRLVQLREIISLWLSDYTKEVPAMGPRNIWLPLRKAKNVVALFSIFHGQLANPTRARRYRSLLMFADLGRRAMKSFPDGIDLPATFVPIFAKAKK